MDADGIPRRPFFGQADIGAGPSGAGAFLFASTPSLERQQWLELAGGELRTKFAAAGYSVPEKIRVSIGWPKRAASCGAIGECWSTEASSDRHAELFISPEITEGAEYSTFWRTNWCTRRSAPTPNTGRRLNGRPRDRLARADAIDERWR